MNKKHILNTDCGVIIKKNKTPLQKGLFTRIRLPKYFNFGPVLYHHSLIGLFEDEILPHHEISFYPYHRLNNSQYINHADIPSCMLLKKEKVIHLIAATSLNENQEITLNFPQACEVLGIEIPEEYHYLLFHKTGTEK